ncbi:MAG: hypothetical protein ACJ8M1_10670 [Chthoniobacterales bacterium]
MHRSIGSLISELAPLVAAMLLGTAISASADTDNRFYFRVERFSGPGVAYFDRAIKEIER